MSPSKFDLDFN